MMLKNAPKTVWRPGSARTRWGSLSAHPDPLAAMGPTTKGRGGEEDREREGRGPRLRYCHAESSHLPTKCGKYVVYLNITSVRAVTGNNYFKSSLTTCS